MGWQYTPYNLPLFLSSVLSVGVAFYIWRRRTLPGGIALFALMVAVTLWTVTYAFQVAGSSLATKLLWARIQYLGIVAAPAAWLVFALQYSRRISPLSRFAPVLIIEPAVTLGLVWTSGRHELFWQAVGRLDQGAFAVMTVEYGPVFWLHAIYSYGLLLAGTVLLLLQLFRSPQVYWGQGIAVVAGCLAPWVANAVYLSGFSPFSHLDLTPFSFALTGLALSLGIFRYQLLELAPVAHHLLIEQMGDGLLVLDAQDCLVEINPAARRMLEEAETDSLGRSVHSILEGLPEGTGKEPEEKEIVLGEGRMQRCCELRFSPLYDVHNRPIGRLVLLHDIAGRKRREVEQECLQQVRDQIWGMEGSRDIGTILEAVSDGLRMLNIPFTYCGINLVDTSGGAPCFTPHSLDRVDESPATHSGGSVGEPLRSIWASGESSYRPDLHQEDPHGERRILDQVYDSPIRSLLDVPFSHGTLALNSTEPDAFSEEDIASLQRLAEVLSEGFYRADDLRQFEEHHQQLEKEVAERRQVDAERIRLSQAVENSPVTVVITDPNGVIEYANPFFTKVTGYTVEEAIGQNPRVLSSGKHPPQFYKEMWDTLLAGEVWIGEFINRKKSGEDYYEKARIAPICDEKRGEITHFVAVKEDITDIRRAEEELRHSQQRLDMAIHGAELGLWDWDMQSGQVVVNDVWGELFGYAEEEVPTDFEEWSRLVHADDLDQAWELFHRHEAGELEVFRSEHRRLTRSGDYRWSLDAGRIVERDGEGKPLRVIGVTMDIEVRKQFEEGLHQARKEAEAANQAKSEFLANMSHEIRTPMQGIIGMTELVLDTELDDHQREYLETVRTSSSALEMLINDILDLSRVEAGRLELERSAFSLRTRVEEVVKSLSLKARDKGLALTSQLAEGVPEWVEGDPLRLWQILENLIGNALKFTAAGAVAVAVDVAERVAGDEVLLHFFVRDTGIGIPADKQEQIFDMFTQTDTSITRQYGGSGLGLAICARLVALMGGELCVESEEGQGSTFHFTARLKVLPAPDLATPLAAAVDKEETAPLRILVAEDTLANQRLIRAILEKRGHTVKVVDNGELAVSAFAGDSFDLVLMDVQMPLLGGYAATERIRLLEQSGDGHTPIVALTAHALAGTEERCREAGMDCYLRKPFRPGELVEMVARCGGKAVDTGREDREGGELTREQALEQVEGDEELLRVMVDTVVEQCPESLAEIRAALENGDGEELTQAAHGFKSVLGLLGDNAAFTAAVRLEAVGREEKLEQAAEAFADLEEKIEAFTLTLTGFVAGSSRGDAF